MEVDLPLERLQHYEYDRPEPSDEQAEVRARTSAGDIVVRRSA